MKIIVESTTKTTTLNGVPARIWEGATESGIPVTAFITRIGVDILERHDEFERELQDCKTPRPENEGIPARLIL